VGAGGRPLDLSAHPNVVLALGIVLCLAGLTALIAVVARIVGLITRSVVARLPVLGAHPLDLAAPGSYAIHVEGPMFSRMPGGPTLQFFGVRLGGPRLAMIEEASGAEVPVRAPLLPVRSSGFASARHQIGSFRAERAGRYRLSSEGVAADRDWSSFRFVVSSDYSAQMLALILGALVGLFTLLAGLALVAAPAIDRSGL